MGSEMIRSIIRHEMLVNLLNLRFVVGLLLSVVLSVTCVLLLTHQYRQELADYTTRVSLQDDFLGNYAHTNRIGGVITPQKPPEPIRPFIAGIQRDADLGSFDDNPLPVLFPYVDFIFIITIIMSLLAILFSYDSIAGERESGTLKLMQSSSIPRAAILLGKWIGGLAVLLVPLAVSVIIGALYVTVQMDIRWTGSDWLSFLLLVLASATFISLFYGIGLFISSVARYASVSILASLSVWVLFILVIPNLSPYLAAQFYRIPSVTRVEREVERLTSIERDNLGRELSGKVNRDFESRYGQTFRELLAMNSNEIVNKLVSRPELAPMYSSYREQINKAWDEANRIQGEKAEKISNNLSVRAKIQTGIAKNIACISPYADYLYIATDLTGTGLRSLEYFSRVADQYRSQYYRYQERKVQEATRKDPTFDSNSFLDIRDRPRFTFVEEPLKERLDGVLPFWGVLLFFNVVFFAGAFVSFLRYDVR
jgi:ABC-type transport system involved in multi-copper enzyme maturation permease subunit